MPLSFNDQLSVIGYEFSEDLYGKFIAVQLISKLRDEIKFDSFEQLQQQILTDADQAKVLMSAS